MSEEILTEAKPAITYNDDDLVYVDPQARIVMGRVEFTTNGKPKPMPLPQSPKDDTPTTAEDETEPKRGKGRVRARRVRYCPWGTYRSMKRVFKLEGKPPRVESQKTLDEVIERALQEPFWD